MQPAFILHLQHNWPLAVIVGGLILYIPIVLLCGVFYTNQGKIVRSQESARYWRWVVLIVGLLLACSAVFFGSYFLSNH